MDELLLRLIYAGQLGRHCFSDGLVAFLGDESDRYGFALRLQLQPVDACVRSWEYLYCKMVLLVCSFGGSVAAFYSLSVIYADTLGCDFPTWPWLGSL